MLELRDVSKTFGRHRALDRISFGITAGEVIGLLGDNGAGKSTLVKILSGVLAPSDGAILADGAAVQLRSHGDAGRVGIETIYQDTALVGSMAIYRNMFLGRERTWPLGFLKHAEMRRTTQSILRHSVGIGEIGAPTRKVSGLSGGQRQAVAIARAVHFRKRMLLLDEPTSALSVRETENVLRYIEQLRTEGVSCLFVTHNLHHAWTVCDRFVVLSLGRKVLDAPRDAASIAELTRLIVAA